MPLTSSIVPYDPSWPEKFLAEKTRLSAVFGPQARAIHNIGSTSVPGLSAKPEIDILVVIDDIGGITAFDAPLAELGYRTRGDFIANHYYFTRDSQGHRTHKLHVCEAQHASVLEFLTFRDLLRENDAIRDAYQSLKSDLEKSNRTGIREYLDGKKPFIEETLAEALGR